MIKTAFELLFYAVMLLLAIYSLIMIYTLLRFGQSKILGLIVTALYIVVAFGLFGAAVINFNHISFPETFF